VVIAREAHRLLSSSVRQSGQKLALAPREGSYRVKREREDSHLSTREDQWELDRVLLVFSSYLYREIY